MEEASITGRGGMKTRKSTIQNYNKIDSGLLLLFLKKEEIVSQYLLKGTIWRQLIEKFIAWKKQNLKQEVKSSNFEVSCF